MQQVALSLVEKARHLPLVYMRILDTPYSPSTTDRLITCIGKFTAIAYMYTASGPTRTIIVVPA